MDLFDFSQYTWWCAAIQSVVAFVIYYITNWLGGHTPASRGYMSLSLVIEEDTMPAFNFIFKTLTPIVLYIFYMAICQSSASLTFMACNSYMVIVYYWVWRLLYYIFHGILCLVNWLTFFMYIIVTIGLAMILYSYAESVDTILPSKNALRDQLWILIAIFVYQVLNNLRINRAETEERKRRYVLHKHAEFQKKYGDVISADCDTLVDEGLVYSIMIMENYNRPPFIRLIEDVKFCITHKKMSLGLMQVKTIEYIGDKESVRRAIGIIVGKRKEYIRQVRLLSKEHYKKSLSSLIEYVANEYNGSGDNYANEVEEIFKIIYGEAFPDIWKLNVFTALRVKNDIL